MYAIRGSTATSKYDDFVERERTTTGPTANLDWVGGCLADLEVSEAGETLVLLLGGRSAYDFRLRVAQSHLRADMTPSHWSHAALVDSVGDPVGTSALREVSLEPRDGFGMPSATNAVQSSTLDWYADPDLVPNIALLCVPTPPDGWRGRNEAPGRSEQASVIEQFSQQRVIVDLPGLVLRWMGFVWGAGQSGNPLLDGDGVPSAVMIETLVSAAGYDLTPGLDSRAATPEGFWQTALWWHTYFELQDRPPVRGFYCVTDRLEYAPPRSHPATP